MHGLAKLIFLLVSLQEALFKSRGEVHATSTEMQEVLAWSRRPSLSMPRPLPVNTACLMPAEPFLKLENWVSMMLTLLALDNGMTFTTSDFLALLPAGKHTPDALHCSAETDVTE